MMNLDEIKTAIHSHNKGSFTTIETCKTLKTKKAYADKSIVKVSRMTGRFGCSFENLKSTKIGRENGSIPKNNSGLPYGNWVKGWEGYLIEHKGIFYVRVASSPNKSKTIYLVNGVPTGEDIVRNMCLASEFHKGEKPAVFNIKADNIVNIG